MRLLPTLGAFIVCVVARIQPQEPPLPNAEKVSPSAGSAAHPTAPPEAPQLIPVAPLSPATPPSILPTPIPLGIPQLDEAFKQSPLSAAAENARHHLEWRTLRNQVVVNPKVKKALAAAEAAPTDLEKRKLLRQYYELLYSAMISLASTPELKSYLNDRKNEQMGALPQPRVRPTPSPTPPPKG